MENIIEIFGLSKSFKDVKAVDNLKIRVKKGEFYSFLGINGAGKSTTISIMCGRLTKDSGKITIDNKDIDHDLDQIKSEIGVVFQNSVLDKQLTVYDNLRSRASLYGIGKVEFEKRLDELAKMLHFEENIKRTFGKLSGGQRRKIDIARALFHHPKILILDEPTTGLDPQTRQLLWSVINELRVKENLTIFLTTHYMEEVSDSDYIVILDEGKIVAEGTPLDLKNKYTGDYVTLYNIEEDKVKSLNLPYEKIRDAYRICVKNTNEAKELILKHPDLFVDFEISKGKMDDVFLNATGKKLIGGER